MTVAALPIGGPYLGCAPSSRGFSPAAEKLCGLLAEALSARTSVTLGGRYYALAEAAVDAMERDWDGYGAWPVDLGAVTRAKLLLRALPTTIPEPDIGVEPGGHIGLDWYGGPGRAFTITIHGNGELKYATLFGRDRDYGSAQFVEEIPEQVAYHLGKFLDRSA
jgi:hypothetical protein